MRRYARRFVADDAHLPCGRVILRHFGLHVGVGAQQLQPVLEIQSTFDFEATHPHFASLVIGHLHGVGGVEAHRILLGELVQRGLDERAAIARWYLMPISYCSPVSGSSGCMS